ncbi:MAG: hypothetical protein LBL06_02170 [Treponema sp.]|nr:hypothetical protein [Treponema sp.]
MILIKTNNAKMGESTFTRELGLTAVVKMEIAATFFAKEVIIKYYHEWRAEHPHLPVYNMILKSKS